MPVKIRLQRKGRRKRPFYHIVVADSRAPRDGRFIENIGSYNPMTSPATVLLDTEKALDWLEKGAQPTDTARAILKFKGVLYKKHLQRGVKKGALTQEAADQMFQDFITQKASRIEARMEKSRQEILDRHKAISGTAPAKPEPVVEEEVAEAVEGAAEAVEAVAAEAGEAAEQVAEAATEVVEEAATAVKETVEEVKEAATEVAEEAANAVEEVAEAAAPEAPAEDAPAAEEETKEDA